MSALDRYLQLQLMNEQGGQPTAGPAPQLPPENVPRGTQGFDPLSKGAGEAIKAVRQSIGMKQPSMMGSIFNTLGHAGNALMATDTHPFVQAMGQHGFQQEQAGEQEAAKNMEIMQFLQKAEQARQERMMHESHYAEQARHNRAAEGMHRQELGMKLGQHQEIKHSENLFKEKYGVRGKAIEGMPPSTYNEAVKRQSEYTKKADAALKTIESADILHNLADTNPKIFNSQTFVMFNKYMNDPGYLTKWIQSNIPKEDQDAAFAAAAASKYLFVEGLKGVPAKAQNMRVDMILQGASPGLQHSTNAVKKATSKMKEEAEYFYDALNKSNEFWNQGYDVMVGPRPKGHKKFLGPKAEEWEKLGEGRQESPQQQAQQTGSQAAPEINPEQQQRLVSEREQIVQRIQQLKQGAQ